jgi:3-phenylpropionate/trans-cinnamate dioxygenase ferredoxin reductase component
MNNEGEQFVIVGASMAGVKAAETLREEGFRGRIALIGAEPELPYDRPPLSKGALKGEEDYESTRYHDEQWYRDREIDLRVGTRVTGVDVGAHEASVEGGETLRYDKLLLATGSQPRPLAAPGAELRGVRYLRTLSDSRELHDRFAERQRVVVVGAGWIGLEAAAAARQAGCEVTVVEPQQTALAGPLGVEVGQVYADLHSAHGVTMRFGETVQEVRGDERVTGVLTSGGADIPADLVLAGVGVAPDVGLAEAAGLDIANGVVCDERLCTSDPDVFAAGDIANWFNPLLGYRLRVEHWANAHDGGRTAARAMLGQQAVHDVLPFFWSDQYDTGMEYAGHVNLDRGYDRVVLRGDPGTHEFMAFWLSDEFLLAGLHMNVWDTIDTVQDLIRSGAKVDPDKLADPTVPLDEATATGT